MSLYLTEMYDSHMRMMPSLEKTMSDTSQALIITGEVACLKTTTMESSSAKQSVHFLLCPCQGLLVTVHDAAD